MFNKNESPISLFSFQDIITSLTGIMILILLLMSLNILELSFQQINTSAAKQELELIKQKNKTLKKHNQEILEDIKLYQKRIKSAASFDQSILVIENFKLEKILKQKKDELNSANQKIVNETQLLDQIESENIELSEKIEQLDKIITENNNLENQIEKHQKHIAELKRQIEAKQRTVDITIDSAINKIPLIIECSSSQIYIYCKNTNIKKVFQNKSSFVNQLIREVISELQTFNKNKYYFVFLIKPSAAKYTKFLLNKFRQNITNSDYGIEPILETEGFIYE